MTLTQIKAAVAYYLEIADPTTLTVAGVDQFLIALNLSRNNAQMNQPFEFTRCLVDVVVDNVTGGDLTTAVLHGMATPVEIDQILEVGLFDNGGNLRPVEWTTVGESMEEQRQDNRYPLPRYPTDAWLNSNPVGLARFVFSADQVYAFPRSTQAFTYNMGLEVYATPGDWVDDDYDDEFKPWTTKGSQYLIYNTVILLNQVIREYVGRQEGNLGPPTQLRDDGLNALRNWDILKFEQSRRQGR